MAEIDRNRILWHSRRGMLELDLLLEPFARHRFAGLSHELQAAYQQLLACEDQDLYGWLLLRSAPDDPAMEEIIRRILAYAAAPD